MFMTRWLSAVVIFIALLTISVFFVACARPHLADYPAEVMEISGSTFRIKVSAFPEKDGGFVSGQYYRFESLPQEGKD